MRTVRFLLNSPPTGANAWFALAEAREYFAREGVAVEFTAGSGAYRAASLLMDGPYDLAFGDISPMIELNATHPGEAPAAVYSVYNRSPSVIGVAADGPIREPSDLPGRTILGHASDVALRTFAAYARGAGIEPSTVTTGISDAPMLAMLSRMLAGEVDGVFGYASSQLAVLRGKDPALAAGMRFLRFDDRAPDLHGSVVMASRRAVRDLPVELAATQRAVNRGLAATIADPLAAVRAVLERSPSLNADVERERLASVIQDEIFHGTLGSIGLGAFDTDRLARAIALLADTGGLPRRPALAEIFAPQFLPPLEERRVATGSAVHAGLDA